MCAGICDWSLGSKQMEVSNPRWFHIWLFTAGHTVVLCFFYLLVDLGRWPGILYQGHREDEEVLRFVVHLLCRKWFQATKTHDSTHPSETKKCWSPELKMKNGTFLRNRRISLKHLVPETAALSRAISDMGQWDLWWTICGCCCCSYDVFL